MLATRVSQRRVARAEIDRGHAEAVEPGHIGPAELGARLAAHGRGKRRGCRAAESGPGAANGVCHRDLPACEDLTHVIGGLFRRPVGRESVVDCHDALIRYDIAGDSAPDADRVEALVEPQPVDLWLSRLIAAQSAENLCRLVDRIAAHPCPSAVRTFAIRPYLSAQRALASALDNAARRLEQDREVRGQAGRAVPAEPQQAVALGLHLLAVVPDIGHVHDRRRHLGSQLQLHGDP